MKRKLHKTSLDNDEVAERIAAGEPESDFFVEVDLPYGEAPETEKKKVKKEE